MASLSNFSSALVSAWLLGRITLATLFITITITGHLLEGVDGKAIPTNPHAQNRASALCGAWGDHRDILGSNLGNVGLISLACPLWALLFLWACFDLPSTSMNQAMLE
ncbi:hypothetical protein [Helicobacter bizzozeronii]|uniref:hypothetical protein n=1 Tax=Helicobacter bizzozeronii TaxID=56877 RepID=UPI0013158E58|nr:hypothetical protein [Helicobacter bizzozeronii]